MQRYGSCGSLKKENLISRCHTKRSGIPLTKAIRDLFA